MPSSESLRAHGIAALLGSSSSGIISPKGVNRIPRVVRRLLILVCFALATAAPCAAEEKHPEHLLKLATLAPEGSSWVQAMRNIDAEVRQKTDGVVGFKIYPGGVQGDEPVILRKMRIGQLHAGSFAGQGASMVLPDILAMEIPFLFDDYEEIDYVLERMDTFYQKGFEERGFILLGWSDIGFVHILSQKPIRASADIKGLKVWRLEKEPITAVIFAKAGVTSVPLSIPDVLLGLQTNLVEVVYAPPVAAIVLQWFTRVRYLTELPINYTLGTLLVSKRAFEKLSPQHQAILRTVAANHTRAQSLQNREENEEAVEVMEAHGLKLVVPMQEEIESFKQLVRDSIPELVGKAFSNQSFEMVNTHLRDFRRQRAARE